MRHINLKNRIVDKSKFKVEKTSLGYAIKYDEQYLDHDFVLRETNPDYAGVWPSKKAAQDFIVMSS